MDRTTEYLSSYAESLRYSDLPQEVVDKTKRVIIDTLGCALGGYSSDPSKIARAMAEVTCAPSCHRHRQRAEDHPGFGYLR